MIDLEHAVDTKDPPPYAPLKREESDEEDDDANEEVEDSSQALLSQNRARLPHLTEKRWPQIRNIVIESAPSLLLTTVSLLFSGELLDKVSRWRAMRQVHQLIMVIPAVLNLKGNLEMNLSARLGTAANVGELEDPTTRRAIIIGNLTFLQVQAAVVSFIVASLSSVLVLLFPGLLPASNPAPPNTTPSSSPETNVTSALLLAARKPRIPFPTTGEQIAPGFSTFVMVTSTSMASACLSSIVLGSFMCGLVVLCLHFNLDPDNIAPPIASCLGDLVTLLFIGLTSSILIPFLTTPSTPSSPFPHSLPFPLLPFLLLIFLFCSATFALVYTARNPHVRPLLGQGWSPLFGAMTISTGTGIVLEMFVSRYEGFALLAVVISGLPGSVGSILVSRLSTSLHAAALAVSPAVHEAEHSSSFSNSSSISNSIPRPRKEPSTKLVIITLLLVTIPIEIAFLGMIRVLGWLHLPILFVVFSVVFFFCAVTISLLVARFLTSYLWSKGRDPDMYALPIHSALMDLVGQLLLVVCFEIAQLLGARVKMTAPSAGGVGVG